MLRFLLGSSLLFALGCSDLPKHRPLPPGVTFSGTWDSNWGQITLTQRGARVSGQYKGFRNGSLSGESKGSLFTFKWTQVENRQHGRGYLQMTPDGMRLEGAWGYGTETSGGGRWWANRVAEP